MKLSTKLLTGLAATTCIATPLVVLTGCAKTDDAYVVDVSDGYTPSDVHKLNSTANSTLTDAMRVWFNHASLNKLTPMEEFKWSMGEVAKKIKNYNSEEKGIKSYAELEKATAGMTGFEVNDMIERRVSYETKGGFHFNYYVDYTNAEEVPEGFHKLLYKAEVDIDYNVKIKNVSIRYGDGTAALSVLGMLGQMTQGYGLDLAGITRRALPGLAGNPTKLNVFPDLLNLSSDDHTWMFDVFCDANVNVTAGDYQYGSYHLKVDREVDYETTLLLEKTPQIPAYIFDAATIIGMFSIWRSYYVDSLSIPLMVERIPMDDTDDITKPIEISQPVEKYDNVSLNIKVRLNDADMGDLSMINMSSTFISGYSSNFLIPQYQLQEFEEKDGKYEVSLTYKVSLPLDSDDEPIRPESRIVNETFYLPITNAGKWVASIPVQVRATRE